MTIEDGVVKQSTWWPLLLFLPAHARLDRGDSRAGRCLRRRDAAGMAAGRGYVSLAVVNVSEMEDFEVEVKGIVGNDVSVYTATAPQVTATNTEGREEVGMVEGT
ncbi:hypothetical protein F5B21DRAFT_503704 [Xylaria acuta]|nr:hypothetical protein F5B21DRAFT_503704 [Xylaria acuta]